MVVALFGPDSRHPGIYRGHSAGHAHNSLYVNGSGCRIARLAGSARLAIKPPAFWPTDPSLARSRCYPAQSKMDGAGHYAAQHVDDLCIPQRPLGEMVYSLIYDNYPYLVVDPTRS